MRPIPLIVLAAALGACASDPITGGGPQGPNLSTVPGAMDALEQFYNLRQADEAIALLALTYEFVPAYPESIHFLAPGETSWDYDQEVSILEELLEEERTSWIDQVLLDFVVEDVDTLSDGSVEVTTKADLDLSISNDQLEKARSRIVLVYRRNADGHWLLDEERESPHEQSNRTVGELKSGVLTGP
jgi:hypothetical protein